MGTSMEKIQQPQQLLTYKQLFESPGSRFAQILAASSRLGLVLGKVLDPAVLRVWAQRLEGYSPEQLTRAFNRAECEIAAWPAVSQIVEFIERDLFDAAFTLVLQGLKLHGCEWKDVEAWKESDTWDMTSAAAIKLNDRILVRGKIHPAIPAPKIPERMERALGSFGFTGKREDGLRRLLRDEPCFWDNLTSWKTGQHSIQSNAIARDLWAAWMATL